MLCALLQSWCAEVTESIVCPATILVCTASSSCLAPHCHSAELHQPQTQQTVVMDADVLLVELSWHSCAGEGVCCVLGE